MRLNFLARTGVAAVFTLALTSTAPAQSVTPTPADAGQWQYRLAPYLWGAGLEGTVGKFGQRAHVDKGFSDILDGLELGGMLGFEARRGQLGVLGDVLHVRLGESGTMVAPPGVPVAAKATTRTTTALLAAQYRIAAADWGYVDVLGGARYWSLRAEVRLGSPVNIGGKDSERWTDPVIGLKGLYHLGPRSYVMGWGMFGGFGIGSRSSSDLMAALGYKLSDEFAVLLGYRRLAVDYRDGGFVFDVAQQGPAIGLDYRF